MAKIMDVMAGLAIIMKYTPKDKLDDPCGIDAQYEQIWAGDDASEMAMSPEDLARMDELGWFLDDELDSWSKFC